MRLFKRNQKPELTADAAAALEILQQLVTLFDVRVSRARIAECWQAAPSESPGLRVLEAAATLGLRAVPARYDVEISVAQRAMFVTTAADAGLINPLADGDAATIGLGEAWSTRPAARDVHHAWTFVPADSEDRSADARLKAINPIKNLGSGRMFWVLLAAFLSNILGLATSLFVMVVYDRVLPNGATESLYALAFGVGAAVLFDTLLKSSRARILDNATETADRKITEDIFDQYVEAQPTKTGKSVGELASVIRNFETYREFTTSATILAFVDLPFVLLFIFVISQISGLLWVVPAVAVPTVLILVLMVQPLVARNSKRATALAQSRQSMLVEMLSGLDYLRVTGAFGIFKRRFLTQAASQTEAQLKARNSSAIVGNVVNVLQQLFQVAVIVLGFHLFVTDQVTMGGIIAAVILFGRVMTPLSRLGQTLGRANQAFASYKVVRDFLALDRNTDTALPAQLNATRAVALELANVTLRLSENAPPLFNGISLSVKEGEKVAIVGRTGSGKSSILRLMSGLLRAETGSVLCHGISVSAYPRADLHRRVGHVFQATWAFAGTLRENISLNQVDVTDDAIHRSLRMAGLTDTTGKEMPLDMQIYEQGANLSGGQRQALSLARVFAASPEIYLLDEPSSAMDSQLEARLVKNIQTELSDKTIVIVTHKAKLLELCDRVIVVDQGQIKGDLPAKEYFDLTRKKAGNWQDVSATAAPKVTVQPMLNPTKGPTT
ncbi:ATP-binding cassette domain-containing protein [Octadecabacter sp. G9-8]|uniref:ATP-binding cassette domain-containing protein n=1 Tax=Octadecabacter dasysiphoniae TaxID=2909341 RepID=A0ABS9CYG7_9RHOB|nr:ATP-binding cassette domain-containing protein [Octadecabacter dasysiphoniae]MCF2871867.1 ATP-binding cassette domain-containing protein [Octadecabacter dasysiphoniae]